MNTMLSLAGLDSAEIAASSEARKKRDQLLLLVQEHPVISSPETATTAAILLSDLKNFTRVIEAARVDVKGPVLDLAKRIDSLARELTGQLEEGATRLSHTLGAYQAEQNRKAEAARRAAWEEEQRIIREAQEAERLAAEQARKEAADLAAKEQRARTEAGAARARMEAEIAAKRAEDEAQARADAARFAVIETRVTAAAAIPPKPAGTSIREELCFEIEDIVKLYESAPYLVTLTPNTAAIKNALKVLTPSQHLPGIRHWREQKAVVR